MELFLTHNQLEQLTGYSKPSAQARELERRGYTFEINKRNEVLVSRQHVEKKLNGIDDKPSNEPNFDYLDL